MPSPAQSSKFRILGQVAVVALLAGAAAGCSADVTRFANPFEVTSNRTQIVGNDAVVTGSLPPAPTTPVASNTLPPPVSSNTLPPPPTQQAAAYPAPTTLQPQPAATSTASAGTYVVQPGDSLGRIANDRGLRSIELASFNGIDPSAPIKVGQKLRIPDGAKPAPTQVAALGAPGATATDAQSGVIPAPGPAPLGVIPAGPAQSVATPAPGSPAPPVAGKVEVAALPSQANPQMPVGTGVESSTTGNFRWPVRGRVISAYGVKANGERNDGINIEVPEGTPIKAAEGGVVIYSGNELKGYGNLVLIKHPNGFVSAYAHASEVLVKRDDVIMRGQTIGKVGATGNVPRPQLHFEIREGNKPVDPIPFLAG